VIEVGQLAILARQKLYESTGIYISGNQLEYFERQITQRIKALNHESDKEYLQLLESGDSEQELHQLLKIFFVGDTRFFNHRFQMSAIVEQAIPQLFNEKKCDTLNIWYHGLGNGEGLYSLMLLLHEQNRRFGRSFKYSVIGSDLSEEALAQTEQAVYRNSSVSHLGADMLERYFEAVEGRKYRFLPLPEQEIKLKMMVPHDESQWQDVGQPDLIVFQNIMMYYGLSSRQQIARQLYQVLPPQGYLFVGPTESLYQVTDDFRIVHFTKTLGYKKPVASS
jgi:chemotaxis protein methyltransferase CheR